MDALQVEGERARRVFQDALRTALGRPPIWLVCWLFALLGGAIAAGPWLEGMRGEIGHAYARRELTFDLGEAFRIDHRAWLASMRASTAVIASISGAVAVALGAFTAGGWLNVLLERTRGESLRRFFLGGARTFWPFARLTLLSILALALVAWLLYGEPWKQFVLGGLFDVPRWDRDDLETLRSEGTVVWLARLQAVLFLAWFAVVRVVGDYARTRLALHEGRSAIVASLGALYTIGRHPWRTLRPLAALFLVQLAALFVLGLFVTWFQGSSDDPPGMLRIALLGGIGQLGAMFREVCRGATYAATVRVSTGLQSPLAGGDPWSSSIGGPGGPRYPIDDADEFGIGT